MKAFHSIIVLALGGVLISGCATGNRPSGATPSQRADAQDPNRVAEETGESPAPVHLAPGNPEAFARFATGVTLEENDEEGQAITQYDNAALADPSNEKLVIFVAERYLKNKETAKALSLLTKSAHRPDSSAMLLSWLARAQLASGHADQALVTSKLAIQRSPGSLDGYECQIAVYLHNSKFPEALKTLDRAAHDVHPDPLTLATLADLYLVYLKDQPKDAAAKSHAVAVLDREASLKFTAPEIWQRLADAYAGLDQTAKAAEIYKRLLTEYPDGSTVLDALHEKLAGIYLQAEDRTNAIKQLEAIVRDNPTSYPRAWYFLGELAYEGGKPAEAIDNFEHALRWDPSIEQAYYDLALAELDVHRSDDAFKVLDRAHAQFPKSFAGEFYTGVVYAHVKNYTDAIHHFKEAEIIGLATVPALLDQRFYFQFGAACERDKQFKPAEEYLQKCIDRAPDFAEALNYLGFMLADIGQELPKARAMIEKAIKLDPKNGAYLDSMGWVLYKLDLPKEALPWMIKAEQFTPEPDPTVEDHLGDVYISLGLKEKAVAAWKKSLTLEPNDAIQHKVDQFSGAST